MPKRVALLLLALQFLLMRPFASCSAESDALESKLSAPVHDYSLTANNFAEGLIRVATQFQIPMGIEWVNTPTARTQLTLDWKDVTLQEILDEITKTQPGYEVRVSNGVVHVCSMKIPPNQNFLHLKIKLFEAHHDVVDMAERRLRDLVQSNLVAPKSDGGGRGGSLAANVGETTVELQLRDVTVETILDSLATASTRKIWVVTFVDSFIPTASGFRRTLTLWNDAPVPDDQQPVWDTFHWGDPIPSDGLATRF